MKPKIFSFLPLVCSKCVFIFINTANVFIYELHSLPPTGRSSFNCNCEDSEVRL